MKRIVVYGNANRDKDEFVSDLQLSSPVDFSFISSTPNNRFTAIDNGRTEPIFTAPWQLLVVAQHDQYLESATGFETTFFQCDLDRPLIMVFYGQENGKTANFIKECKDFLANQPTVRVLSTDKLENLNAIEVISEFKKLEALQQPSADKSQGLAI